MNTEPNDLPVASSEDDREAAWERHVAEVAPWRADHRDRDIAARGQAYRAGFDAGWSACRSPVSPPEDVARWREHSVILNRAGYRLAVLLGDIPDGAESVEADPLDLIARIGALRSFVEDLAGHGVRFDLNPTVDSRRGAFAYLDYLARIDQSIRERATEALRPTREEGDRG